MANPFMTAPPGAMPPNQMMGSGMMNPMATGMMPPMGNPMATGMQHPMATGMQHPMATGMQQPGGRQLPRPMGIPGPVTPYREMPPPRDVREAQSQQHQAQYEWAAHHATQRLQNAAARHHELVHDVNLLSGDEYSRRMKKEFKASSAAELSDVDWRVPRLMYCKDPKYNMGVPPHLAFEVQDRKQNDGTFLEEQLSRETYDKFKKAADDEYANAYKQSQEENAANPDSAGDKPPAPFKHDPPPDEMIYKKGVPFLHAVPMYQRADDLWNRRLELRTMEEAMRGDVSQPLPRPVIFEEDFENFKQGKYVKDDCPIA